MKNLLASWFRNLTAFDESPIEQSFSIVDPTAASSGQDGLNTVVLAVAPSDGNSPTIVSLRFDPSGVKLFEKKYQNDAEAQEAMSAMANDLSEAATLSKIGKTEEAKHLAESLFEKYKRHSDPLVNEQPTSTMTQASMAPLAYKGFSIKKLEDGSWQGSLDEIAYTADSIDTLKAKIDNAVRKAYGKQLKAGITMQNLFFDTADEAMEFQEKMKALQGPEESVESKPLWEQMGNGDNQVAPSNETAPGEDNELAPPSLSFDRIEKDKAKHDKDIGKRIKDQVKTEVESALEQKSASVFGPEQEELVEALRKNGRNWDEIKKIFTKELSYNEDDTSVFLDSIRAKEEGGPAEGLPLPPKPPEDLVSPDTHDKLIKEIEDKSEPKPEPLPLADEIARADNAEIRKVANWQDNIQNVYSNYEEFLSYDRMYSLHERLGYESAEDLWQTNPIVQGSTNPADYKVASKKVAINPLQEPPAIGQTPGQPLAAPVEENPTFDSPVPPSQDTNPEPEFLEAPKTGDRVYVMGDYETGEDGYEGTMVSEYTSKGDEYAVISKDDGDNAEVALHRVVKASQKKVAQVYYEKKADAYQPKTGEPCSCRPGIARDNCPSCEGTGSKIDFQKIRERTAAIKCPKCDKEIWDYAKGHKLNKCWNCGTAFDSPEQEVEASEKCHCGHAHDGDVCDDCPCRIFNNTKKAKLNKKADTTTDLAQFGNRERGMARELLNAWHTQGLPEDFYDDQVTIMMNTNSGNVFLTNADYQVAMIHGGRLESFYSCPYCGHEGFKDEMLHEPQNEECTRYLQDIGVLPQPQQPEDLDEIQSLHESALKLQAELEHEGEVAIYFTKEAIEKKASDDSAFESNGWCRVWVQDLDISSDLKYQEILKLPDENARIAALKDLARDIAHENLLLAESSANNVGVQSWFEGLTPSRHDRIDWVALATPEPEEVESAQDSKIEKQAVDPAPVPEAPKEVPTTFKKHLKAPPATDREKALPATQDQAQLVKDVESSLSNLEAIKSMVNQAKAKLNEEIKAIEEKGGRVQIEGELKEKIERLSKLVEATQNQMVYAGDTMVRLIQETKERPFNPSDKWKVEKLTERLSKYEDAAKYLDQAVKGAQSLATSEDIRELYFFPRRMSKLHKSAGFLETLDAVYNDVLEALKLVIGNNQEEPAVV